MIQIETHTKQNHYTIKNENVHSKSTLTTILVGCLSSLDGSSHSYSMALECLSHPCILDFSSSLGQSALDWCLGLLQGPWVPRGVSVGAETSYKCRGICKWQNLGDCEGGWHLGRVQGGKATIGLVVVRRGTIEIFRNCRVSGSERIKKCPSASEPRTGSHKSAIYWGYHGLHGEWWHLCHKIRQVVWHSSQCVTRWWVENSEPPQTNMYAYLSSPSMGDDCHRCDDIELCSWSGRDSWWNAIQYTGRVAL